MGRAARSVVRTPTWGILEGPALHNVVNYRLIPPGHTVGTSDTGYAADSREMVWQTARTLTIGGLRKHSDRSVLWSMIYVALPSKRTGGGEASNVRLGYDGGNDVTLR
ncbi:hypothetical protein BaRGS_00022240 [Batillaria attramentaria]|uniref:Uncharacterized protein n=1 Tax=Batillaria attramentaria TaxID=370345 RepID=A0ABD0KHD1_9CAEN